MEEEDGPTEVETHTAATTMDGPLTGEISTLVATTTVLGRAMAAAIMATMEAECSITITNHLAYLEVAESRLLWVQVQAFWEGPWQAWLLCPCTTNIECTQACSTTICMECTPVMDMATVRMDMVAEACWLMSLIALEDVQCKLSAIMAFAGAELDMMLGNFTYFT